VMNRFDNGGRPGIRLGCNAYWGEKRSSDEEDVIHLRAILSDNRWGTFKAALHTFGCVWINFDLMRPQQCM